MRSQGSSDRRLQVKTPVRGERLVKQEFKGESDVNSIMRRIKRTGVLPESFNRGVARYGGFSQVPDFATMHDRVMAARELFMALPAQLS